MKQTITVETSVQAPRETVWSYWTEPEHIMRWYHASDDWGVPSAKNDLHVGGRFVIRMEANDGSAGFDFSGTYTDVRKYDEIGYAIDDGRIVRVTFSWQGDSCLVTETFESEVVHPVELQRSGWQSILDTFKKYVETSESDAHAS